MPIRIDVIFDVPPGSPYHEPTLAAIRHAATATDLDMSLEVVRTDSITDRYFAELPHGVVVGPGSPYAAPAAAEEVIRTARERGVPLVAT